MNKNKSKIDAVSKKLKGDAKKNFDKLVDTLDKYASKVAENAELVVQYPFLLPLDYQGKVPKDYDFTYTEVDMVPKGWHSIVRALSEEIRFYLVNKGIDPYAFHIDQLKEKFGSIRLYYSLHLDGKFDDEGIDEIIQKYEELSEHKCCECGEEATLMSKGWICPYCQKCADKLKAEEGKHWDFAPLERSAWTKIKDSQIFSYGEMKNEAKG